jgi:glutamyl-tRNA synthetase
MTTRTRFAPSPTGFLHVGGLRTALYAYLLAKKNNGAFVLRIEDTDQTRLVPGAVENIINTLKWAGINFDESYVQSERRHLYAQAAEQLIASGHAYECFCSPERLDAVRAEQMAKKLPPAYDKACRALTREQVAAKKQECGSFVIRMKVPEEGSLTFHDVVRGDVTFNYANVDDQVIIKSDGFPTYHLAVVVDDHDMAISHVIRGEEWLSSTPKHILLYQFLGWQTPIWAHLPLLLNADRSKLSKRQGDVAAEDYRQKGFLPEALINFVAFLGWNPGDTRELFTMDELIQEFTLERVGKSGAVFNVEKLHWYNQQHLHKMSDAAIAKELEPMIKERGWNIRSEAFLLGVITLLKERTTFLADFLSEGTMFFEAPSNYEDAVIKKCWKPETAERLCAVSKRLKQENPTTTEGCEALIRTCADEMGIGAGALMQPLRLAIAGVGRGANLFTTIALLGADTVEKRIQALITTVG